MRFSFALSRARVALIAAGVLLLMAGCSLKGSITPIKTLLDDPAQFDGKNVRIAGDVKHSAGVAGYGAYEIDDGTGKLPVVSKSGSAPRDGAHVGVEGTFKSYFTLGSTSAAAIVEKKRFTP
jgi:hypothetical protein